MESMMVYTALTRMMGLIMGKVTFQKFSQPVAPSMVEASYREGDMVCRPARKMRICTPEAMVMSCTRSTAVCTKSSRPPLRFSVPSRPATIWLICRMPVPSPAASAVILLMVTSWI